MKLQKETYITRSRDPGHGRWYGDACAAAFALELVGERWALLVMRELMLGPRRFSDLRASLPGISAKVLTQRLESLESAGVLVRRRLPPPAAAQVYELTEWGYEAEEVLQVLGRWAVRSPAHDPTLPLTPVALMLSLRTMIDLARSEGFALTVAFDVGGERFLARLEDGEYRVARSADPDEPADLHLAAPAPLAFLRLFYGKILMAELERDMGLTVAGDRDLAERFVALFALPAKRA